MSVERRNIVRGAAGAFLNANFACWGDEKVARIGNERPGCLVRDFPNLQFEAMSPNGQWLCLNRGNWISRFSLGSGGVFRHNASKSHGVSMVEIPTWKEGWARTLPDNLSGASFFSDGDRLLGEARISESGALVRFLQDIRLSRGEDRTIPSSLPMLIRCYAYSKDTVIVFEQGITDGRRFQRLWNGVLGSNLVDVAQVENGGSVSAAGSESMTPPTISLDRECLVHTLGLSIFCRRSRDLRLEWSRVVAGDHRPWRLGISATGTFVVAAMQELGKFTGRARERFVVVFDGTTGRELQRIVVDGTGSVAVSGDGRLVAAGSTVEATPRPGRIRTLVRVFDTRSGRELGALHHAETATERRLESGLGVGGLEFTPDGKYLVSSGISTRIWNVDACFARPV